jgi:hypothetical protein
LRDDFEQRSGRDFYEPSESVRDARELPSARLDAIETAARCI